LFTVNVPTTSGGIGNNGKNDIAVLDVTPRLSVSILESRYHGGGILAVAEEPLEELLLPDVVGVPPPPDSLLDPAEPGLLTETVQVPHQAPVF
jgi:hypothetical protein